jgi:hypothetical protein
VHSPLVSQTLESTNNMPQLSAVDSVGLNLPSISSLIAVVSTRIPRCCCQQANITTGGRTAWSSTVTVQGRNFAARYWYDGQYINNAKEDAAEVALTTLRNPAITQAGQASYRTQSSYGSAGWAGRHT